jgi:hypothetical protein
MMQPHTTITAGVRQLASAGLAAADCTDMAKGSGPNDVATRIRGVCAVSDYRRGRTSNIGCQGNETQRILLIEAISGMDGRNRQIRARTGFRVSRLRDPPE